MKVKYAELVNLNNMTVFAVDDQAIFSGSHAYVSNVRFHIIPNRFLPISELERLPAGTTLATMEKGESVVVTAAGGGPAPIRINFVRVKVPDVIRNLKIVVHSVYLPFPHLHNGGVVGATTSSYDHDQVSGGGGEDNMMSSGVCAAVDDDTSGTAGGACVGPSVGDVAAEPTAQFQPLMDLDDHHGL